MLATLVYAACTIASLVIVIVLRILSEFLRYTRRVLTSVFLHHLYYPVLVRRRWFWPSFTRWRVLLSVLYYTGNLICGLANFQDGSTLADRAGMLSLINLVPLIGLPNFAQASSLLGLQMPGFRAAHGTIGVMMLVQAILHVVTEVQRIKIDMQNDIHFWGTMATVALASLFGVALARNYYYEFVSKIHVALVTLIVISLYYHVRTSPSSIRYWILAPLFSLAVTSSWRLISFLWRNFSDRHSGNQSKQLHCVKNEGTVKVVVKPGRTWTVRAGQFVYLWIPGISFWSFLQLHPFVIVWWEEDSNGKANQLEFLVEIQDGWTRHFARSIPQSSRLRLFMDGPYGCPTDFGEYGSVILFATGIGIAAQIPNAKALVDGYARLEVRTRRIQLIWRLDEDDHQNWVQIWMQKLLDLDRGSYILQITLYVLANSREAVEEKGMKLDYGNHERLRKLYDKPDVSRILTEELGKPHGSVLVSVAADGTTRDEIREIVRRQASERVRLHFSEFQPQQRQSSWREK